LTLVVRRAMDSDRARLGRMLELYQHDLSDLWPQDLDERGEYGYQLDRFFGHDECAAFIFLVHGQLAGFALVDDSIRLPGNQRWMNQFFVLKKYRRQRFGHTAAAHIFDAMPGRRATWLRLHSGVRQLAVTARGVSSNMNLMTSAGVVCCNALTIRSPDSPDFFQTVT
jgi:GNAT superfamily N-acetyltransferase